MLRAESFSTTVLDTKRRRVTVEGRRLAMWFGATNGGCGAVYARPSRVLVAEGGAVRTHPIPDTAMRVRLAFLALLLGAWILRRS